MKRIHRSMMMIACALLMGGCAFWHEPATTPRQPLSLQQHQVRITRQDSTRVVLTQAVFFRDTLSGVANGRRVAVAVSDIAYVQYRRPGKVPTEGVLGVAVFMGLLVGVYSVLVFLFPSE